MYNRKRRLLENRIDRQERQAQYVVNARVSELS
jgi:hypothetical protein